MRKIMVPVCGVNQIRMELLCKSVDRCAKFPGNGDESRKRSMSLGCDDREADLQFVLHLDGAAADLYGRDAVVRLQNRNFSLCPQFACRRAHAQGKAYGLFHSVKVEFAG